MKRFGFLAVISVISLSSPAMAGFEWMPPSKNPAPTMTPTQQYNTLSYEESMRSDGMTASPSMPVMSEPLAPTSLTPRQQARNDGKLYIDPYPLQDSFKHGEPGELSGSSVEKAMVEESRMLHPLHLGAGMKTGAQPEMAPADEMYYQTAGVPMESMTPMVNGEPAALPGMGMPRGPMQAMPIGGFTQAVGFGRDLPLALALSQVVPDHYTHSYGANVDPGVTVSWEGGKPWNEVLNDMLSSKGLMASIQGNQVTIQSAFQS